MQKLPTTLWDVNLSNEVAGTSRNIFNKQGTVEDVTLLNIFSYGCDHRMVREDSRTWRRKGLKS